MVIAIQTWRRRFSNKCVLIRSDNSAVVAGINNLTSRSPEMMRFIRHLFVIVLLNNISVRAVHTPGSSNVAADALSRGRLQVFRRIRPAADPLPAVWHWPNFITRRR